MKKLSFILFLVINIVLLSASVCAQDEAPGDRGLFDTVVDGFGKRYSLASLSIRSTKPMGQATLNAGIPSTSCSAGYFNLFFAPNMAFGSQVTATAVALAQDIVCKAFSDVSAFIHTASLCTTSGVGPKVNIYIHNAAGGGALAQGTPFYVFTLNPINPYQGFIDGLVY